MIIFRRIRALFRKDALDAEMADEMRAHVELQTQLNVKAGMAPAEARHAALRSFGNVASIQQQAREQRSGAGLELMFRDFKLSWRSLRRSPGFAVTVMISLALGIGAAT